LSGEACHSDDAVDVSLAEVLEFFITVRRDDIVIIINNIIIVVAATGTVAVVAGGGEDQRQIGFIDVSMVVLIQWAWSVSATAVAGTMNSVMWCFWSKIVLPACPLIFFQ
jgi:hypothetical protein